MTLKQVRALYPLYRRTYRRLQQFLPITMPIMNDDPVSFATMKGAVAEHTRLQKRVRAYQALHEEGWGSLAPGCVLIVGDSLREPREPRYPFYIPEKEHARGCGAFLYDTLMRTELRPCNTHIINSLDSEGRYPHWAALTRFLKPRLIIALGRDAGQRLRKQGIKHFVVRHPAYEKRFQYRSMDAYVMYFLEVLKYGPGK